MHLRYMEGRVQTCYTLTIAVCKCENLRFIQLVVNIIIVFVLCVRRLERSPN